MKMPFGAFAGQELSEIKASYLAWLLCDTEKGASDPQLRAAMAAELRRRAGDALDPEDGEVGAYLEQLADQINALDARLRKFLRVLEETEVHFRKDQKALFVVRYIRARLP